MTKQLEHVKDRRRRQLCAREGCPEASGDRFRCPKHAAEHADKMRARYRAKKEQGARV